jgi:hypothetical protein
MIRRGLVALKLFFKKIQYDLLRKKSLDLGFKYGDQFYVNCYQMLAWPFSPFFAMDETRFRLIYFPRTQWGFSPGLPDLSWFNIPKREKMHQITIKYTKLP